VELAAEARHGRATARASYSLQKTTEAAGGGELTNSPRHMAKLNLGLALPRGLASGFETQFVSARRTLAGPGVDGFLLTNVTLRAPRLFGRVEASVGVYNLFDLRYADPGSEEHVPDSIPQPRRNFRLKLATRF
jgi:iron complex outermembrane receptor protein